MAYELFPHLFSGSHQHPRSRTAPMRTAYDPFDLFSELGSTCQWMPLNTSERKKPHSRAAAVNWQELVQIPEVFNATDVTVKEDNEDILIRAYVEKGNEKTGSIRHEFIRRVKVPADVEKETLKTLWLNRSHGLVVVGKRKLEEVNNQETDEFQHPLNFLLEQFGVTGCSPCKCQRKRTQQPNTAEKSLPIRVETKVESDNKTDEKDEEESSTEVEKKTEENSSETASRCSQEEWEKVEAPNTEEDTAIHAAEVAPSTTPTEVAPSTTPTEVASSKASAEATPPEDEDKSLGFKVKPFKITVDITGYDKDDVTVDHHGNKITVRGAHEEDGAEYSFVKTFTLPDFVDADNAKWNLGEEALVITAPIL
ncbi:hypothetical protein CAPTEDRAFT_227177 [Capitella teleta]|uniref:SHSP domain-containing protein n=1 Tax=Capitella teleta TaxID=283909 RepID=R7UM88_CAPTE|nr:hypothetical protein CAPTEDRAFT_227177 [Capitella teleta]|eukprot:ELU07629.1 hypothetical protein CAPTEDRAFT_227177 [Capitella teleta]